MARDIGDYESAVLEAAVAWAIKDKKATNARDIVLKAVNPLKENKLAMRAERLAQQERDARRLLSKFSIALAMMRDTT